MWSLGVLNSRLGHKSTFLRVASKKSNKALYDIFTFLYLLFWRARLGTDGLLNESALEDLSCRCEEPLGPSCPLSFVEDAQLQSGFVVTHSD